MRRITPLLLTIVLLMGCETPPRTDSAATTPDSEQEAPAGPRFAQTSGSGYTNLPTVVRAAPRVKDSPKYGPPPPGYIRIVGGTVPDWKPEDMLAAKPRGATWQLLGPRPIINEVWSGNDNASGRVVGIAPHPTNPDIAYIASASGGVWKTTDGGLNWTPLTDELASLNHGAIAIHPTDPNIVYAGTGEYTTETLGDGLFRSLNGGATWSRIAGSGIIGKQCSRIVIDPKTPTRIHVTGDIGYIRSTSGGSTWSRRLTGPASDLAVNPVDPNIVYVALANDGIYRSLNGGTSFTKLTNGLPGDDVHRIILGLAPSNPSVVYTAIVNGSNGLRGFYRTSDGGDTWVVKPNTPDFPNPQGWYDLFVGVDPTDENIVYGGGVFPSYAYGGVVKSTNGGNSWTDITVSPTSGQLHPDQHAIAWGPDGTIWVGNDGGVWKSTDDGATWINTNATLTVTQNYQIALHPSDPVRLMGGTQDNGTVGREYDALDWPQTMGGDGGFAAYDPSHFSRRYTTYVYLTVYRLGVDSANISGPWGNDSRAFIAPLVMDPQNPATLLGGTNRVWRTTNASGAATWTPISTSTVGGGGTLNALAVAPSDSNTVYTGSTYGAVYVTTDLTNWNPRWDGLPAGEVSDILVAPDNPGVAYISFFNTLNARVLRTDDYGQNWTDLTGTLPQGVAVTALEVDWRWTPPHLYVGSGAGMYESQDNGATWTKDGTDLPNVNIGDLKIDFARGTITAGTYGRGAWRKALPVPNLLGDMNCDGFVDFADINPFVDALINPAQYAADYPNCDPLHADLSGNGSLGFEDINPFVDVILAAE